MYITSIDMYSWVILATLCRISSLAGQPAGLPGLARSSYLILLLYWTDPTCSLSEKLHCSIQKAAQYENTFKEPYHMNVKMQRH